MKTYEIQCPTCRKFWQSTLREKEAYYRYFCPSCREKNKGRKLRNPFAGEIPQPSLERGEMTLEEIKNTWPTHQFYEDQIIVDERPNEPPQIPSDKLRGSDTNLS